MICILTVLKIQFSQIVNMSDEEFKTIWPYTYADLIEWCKSNIVDFKRTGLFYEAKRIAEEKIENMYMKRLDNDNPKSPTKKYYSEMGLKAIKQYYDTHNNSIDK